MQRFGLFDRSKLLGNRTNSLYLFSHYNFGVHAKMGTNLQSFFQRRGKYYIKRPSEADDNSAEDGRKKKWSSAPYAEPYLPCQSMQSLRNKKEVTKTGEVMDHPKMTRRFLGVPGPPKNSDIRERYIYIYICILKHILIYTYRYW